MSEKDASERGAAKAASAATREELIAARFTAKLAAAEEGYKRKLNEATERSERHEQRLRQANESLIATRQAVANLSDELAELRSSYYLSGVAKKLDLREIDAFSDLARQVMSEGRSGMNYDRLYILWQAVRAAPPELPIAEVGVYRGGSARFIGETLRRAGRSPRFYLCDTFTGHPRVDPEIDREAHAHQKFQDTSLEAVRSYLGDFDNIEIIVGDIVETAARLAAESFGFAHIDVDVYPATDFCVRFFAPRLAAGAVMVIDDYGFVTCPGAKKAVDDFIAETPGFRLFHLLSGQALLSRAA
jgi:O-methyltransferase